MKRKDKEKVLGKILKCLKNIYLKKQEEFALKQEFVVFSCSTRIFLEITLWYKITAINAMNDLAELLMETDSKYSHLKINSISEFIKEAIKNNITNNNVFQSNVLFLSKDIKTLFDARIDSSELDFALKMLNLIKNTINDDITSWLTLYPLQRIKASSTDIGYLGLKLISPRDNSFWQKLQDKYPGINSWNPLTGLEKLHKSTLFEDKLPFTWLSCEVIGDSDVTKEISSENMRLFISVLYSFLYLRDRHSFKKSENEPFRKCVQFQNINSYYPMISKIGTILPALFQDVCFTNEDINNTIGWLKQFAVAPKELKDRALKAAYFINLAVSKTGIDEFIYFYIALDALFGERDKVEASILMGIMKIFQDDLSWKEKADKLFDLRSELVHGGSYKLEQWKYYAHYHKYYKTSPSEDVTKAALSSLRLFLNKD